MRIGKPSTRMATTIFPSTTDREIHPWPFSGPTERPPTPVSRSPHSLTRSTRAGTRGQPSKHGLEIKTHGNVAQRYTSASGSSAASA